MKIPAEKCTVAVNPLIINEHKTTGVQSAHKAYKPNEYIWNSCQTWNSWPSRWLNALLIKLSAGSSKVRTCPRKKKQSVCSSSIQTLSSRTNEHNRVTRSILSAASTAWFWEAFAKVLFEIYNPLFLLFWNLKKQGSAKISGYGDLVRESCGQFLLVADDQAPGWCLWKTAESSGGRCWLCQYREYWCGKKAGDQGRGLAKKMWHDGRSHDWKRMDLQKTQAIPGRSRRQYLDAETDIRAESLHLERTGSF